MLCVGVQRFKSFWFKVLRFGYAELKVDKFDDSPQNFSNAKILPYLMSEQDSFQIFENSRFNVQRLKFKDSKFREIPQKLIKFFAASFVL